MEFAVLGLLPIKLGRRTITSFARGVKAVFVYLAWSSAGRWSWNRCQLAIQRGEVPVHCHQENFRVALKLLLASWLEPSMPRKALICGHVVLCVPASPQPGPHAETATCRLLVWPRAALIRGYVVSCVPATPQYDWYSCSYYYYHC